MKGIYVLPEQVVDLDIYVVEEAFKFFEYIAVAFQLLDGEVGKDKREDVSRIRLAGRDWPGLSVDFFNKGKLESFLKNSGADFLIVPRNRPFDFFINLDFPRYSID
jgi:hypothetical protein